MTTRTIAAVFAALLTLLSGTTAYGQENDKKISKSQAKRLLGQAFWGKEAQASKAREQLLQCRPEDRKRVFETLESLPIRPERLRLRERRLVLHIEVPKAERPSTPFVVRIPRKYNPKRPAPLLFRFHGTGGSAEGFDRMNESGAFSDFVVVTPEIPTEARLGWNTHHGPQVFDAVYRKVLREFAVDRDRVYLSGFSAGGAAAISFAQWWPHRFAAFRTQGRIGHALQTQPELSMDLLRHVPGQFDIGLADTKDRIDGYLEAAAYYEKNKELVGRFHFTKGVAHEYQSALDKDLVKFFLAQRRERYPKAFPILFYEYRNGAAEVALRDRIYCVHLSKPHPQGTPGSVLIKDNTVTITAERAKRGTVFLNDHIVNMDQPVEIVVNGKTVHSGMVERSMSFLLDWHAKHLDPGNLFCASVAF